MKKEEWINSILETASGIKETDVNPFLYQKITDRLNQSEKSIRPSLKYNLGWAVAISVVIALNVSSLFIYNTKIHKQQESASIEALSNEMISTTNYNY